MYIDITWKTALPSLIGLFAIAIVVMNSGAVGSGVGRTGAQNTGITRSAPASSVCNVVYPVPCTFVQPW
jgi:hypothetical protein